MADGKPRKPVGGVGLPGLMIDPTKLLPGARHPRFAKRAEPDGANAGASAGDGVTDTSISHATTQRATLPCKKRRPPLPDSPSTSARAAAPCILAAPARLCLTNTHNM